MKIAFIGQKGIPTTTGGVEKHVEDLAVKLAQAGHEMYVYTRRNYTDRNLKKYKGVNLINLPNIATKHLDAISHTFLACLDLMRRDYDLIHFHSIGPSSLIWLAKLIKPQTPIIATFHTQCYYHQKWGSLAKLYLQFGEFVLCNFSDRVITISKLLKKYVQDKYDIEPVHVSNGVNIMEVKSVRNIAKWGLAKDSYLFLASRLVKHKGIHYAIKAYERLKTDKKLVIAGDSSFTDDYVLSLKKLAQKNKNIIFTGNQSGRTLAELYGSAYLFIQPSESEGLSIALLEAMSYGRAVLTSDIKENLEAIGDAGFVFKNKSISDLAARLERLLNDPVIVREKGKEGRNRVKKYFSWQQLTGLIETVYREERAAYNDYRVIWPRVIVLNNTIYLFLLQFFKLIILYFNLLMQSAVYLPKKIIHRPKTLKNPT